MVGTASSAASPTRKKPPLRSYLRSPFLPPPSKYSRAVVAASMLAGRGRPRAFSVRAMGALRAMSASTSWLAGEGGGGAAASSSSSSSAGGGGASSSSSSAGAASSSSSSATASSCVSASAAAGGGASSCVSASSAGASPPSCVSAFASASASSSSSSGGGAQGVSDEARRDRGLAAPGAWTVHQPLVLPTTCIV